MALQKHSEPPKPLSAPQKVVLKLLPPSASYPTCATVYKQWVNKARRVHDNTKVKRTNIHNLVYPIDVVWWDKQTRQARPTDIKNQHTGR